MNISVKIAELCGLRRLPCAAVDGRRGNRSRALSLRCEPPSRIRPGALRRAEDQASKRRQPRLYAGEFLINEGPHVKVSSFFANLFWL